jgi:hypothetical protein
MDRQECLSYESRLAEIPVREVIVLTAFIRALLLLGRSLISRCDKNRAAWASLLFSLQATRKYLQEQRANAKDSHSEQSLKRPPQQLLVDCRFNVDTCRLWQYDK